MGGKNQQEQKWHKNQQQKPTTTKFNWFKNKQNQWIIRYCKASNCISIQESQQLQQKNYGVHSKLNLGSHRKSKDKNQQHKQNKTKIKKKYRKR